ncbi:Uncharacterised protein [Mycobacterium tuberculosis]|nr:Uncharacterised protein [Mycobacterium tuberculosis]
MADADLVMTGTVLTVEDDVVAAIRGEVARRGPAGA